MSNHQRRRLKGGNALCAACEQRKARFRYRGRVRADRDHTLCFECYRGEINRARARRFTQLGALESPRCSPSNHPCYRPLAQTIRSLRVPWTPS